MHLDKHLSHLWFSAALCFYFSLLSGFVLCTWVNLGLSKVCMTSGEPHRAVGLCVSMG